MNTRTSSIRFAPIPQLLERGLRCPERRPLFRCGALRFSEYTWASGPAWRPNLVAYTGRPGSVPFHFFCLFLHVGCRLLVGCAELGGLSRPSLFGFVLSDGVKPTIVVTAVVPIRKFWVRILDFDPDGKSLSKPHPVKCLLYEWNPLMSTSLCWDCTAANSLDDSLKTSVWIRQEINLGSHTGTYAL